MVETQLGAGVFLDETLDFDVDETGDLRGEEGLEELAKDLSFQLILVLEGTRGKTLTTEREAEIKSLTEDTLLSDSRVQNVDSSSISISRADRNTVRLSLNTIALGDERELVFEI
jgi:hypothetical protein